MDMHHAYGEGEAVFAVPVGRRSQPIGMPAAFTVAEARSGSVLRASRGPARRGSPGPASRCSAGQAGALRRRPAGVFRGR